MIHVGQYQQMLRTCPCHLLTCALHAVLNESYDGVDVSSIRNLVR
jgi:hypothetical protein